MRVDRPARIDEDDVAGEEELAGIEGDDLSREDEPAGDPERPVVARRADHRLFEPRRVERERRADGEERDERPDVGRGDPPLPPPEQNEKDGRDDARGRLGEEGEREGGERSGVERRRAAVPRDLDPRLPLLRRLGRGRARVAGGEKGVHREKREKERQRVLPLGDPGDRFHAHRMEGEEGCREPGCREAESTQKRPEKQSRTGVEEDVDEVVPERTQAPEVLLEPERREDERVVLLARLRLGPDQGERVRPVERRVLGQVGVVVPDETRLKRRQVGRDDSRHQRQTEENVPPHGGNIAQAGWAEVCRARTVGWIHITSAERRRA